MNRKWSLEKLKKEALKYNSRSEFQKKSKTAYNTALKKGFLNEICLHMLAKDTSGENNPNFKWPLNKLRNEALKYKTRSEFKIKSNRAYQAAWSTGKLDEICIHMTEGITYWTDEALAKEASKYQTRAEFKEKKESAYQLACKRRLIDTVCAHMPILVHPPYTKEELKEEALKYNTRTEFINKNSGVYQSAYRRGYIDKICAHMQSYKWDNEELANEALKYKTRTGFQKGNYGAYATAQKRGIIDKICGHAPKVKGTSIVQKEVANFIKQFYPSLIEETKKIIYPFQIDIYVPDINLAIEYCGLYWHTEEYRKSNYHLEKMKKCKEKGIRLITIFEDEWLEKQEQVKNFLLSTINKNSIRLMGRKTELKEVCAKEAKDFLNTYHIQGSAPTTISFGLYYENQLQAVITGNKHHRQGFENIFVLNRLAFKTDISISGGSSKLLKALINYAKEKGYSKLISWSDNRWSEGRVYEKLGFTLTEELGPDYSYVSKQTRISKQSCQKKHLIKRGAIGTMANTERELALSLNLWRIWDCGKKRWEIKL